MVITAVPCPLFSALVMGGVSCDGDSCTVKILRVLALGEVVLLPQPAAPIARMLTAIARRFIGLLLITQERQRAGQRQDDGQSNRARVQFAHLRTSGSG